MLVDAAKQLKIINQRISHTHLQTMLKYKSLGTY